MGYTYVTTSKTSQLRKIKYNLIENENEKGILFKGKVITLPYTDVSGV